MFITTAGGGAIGAAVLGGLLGGGSSGGGTQTQTSEPWDPAKPWLQNQITTGQNLQNYYQSNPMNGLQKQGYQNLYGSLDNFNSNVAPALQGVANRLMGSNYTRSIGQQNYQQPSIGGFAPQGMQGGQGQGNPQALMQGIAGMQGANPMNGTSMGWGQLMGNNPMMSYGQGGQGAGGMVGPALQQQFQQPQMDVTQGQIPYGLLNWADLMPDVNKLNKDAEATSNAKKPKTNDTSTDSTNSPYSGGN